MTRSPTSAQLAAQVRRRRRSCAVAQINLDYTEIPAPIDGKISRTNDHRGNVVSPSRVARHHRQPGSDVCAVSGRGARGDRSAQTATPTRAASNAVVIRLRLPDGTIYEPARQDRLRRADAYRPRTDTILLRAHDRQSAAARRRADQPVERPTDRRRIRHGAARRRRSRSRRSPIPRAAILSDQQGDFVYVVDADNKAEQRRIQLGQSTPTTAVVVSGLKEGETGHRRGDAARAAGHRRSAPPAPRRRPPRTAS